MRFERKYFRSMVATQVSLVSVAMTYVLASNSTLKSTRAMWLIGIWLIEFVVIWWAIAGWRKMSAVLREREKTLVKPTRDVIQLVAFQDDPQHLDQESSDSVYGYFNKNYLRKQIMNLEANGVVSFTDNEQFESFVEKEWTKQASSNRQASAEMRSGFDSL